MTRKTRWAAGLVVAALSAPGGMAIADESESQIILQDQGTIVPAQQEYPLSVNQGDVLAIIMTSEDFDTVLSLLGPDGEEVASNDDFGGTLNSRIVYSAATAGEYTVVTKSFDGQGGDYDLEVRPATDYEVAYSRAQTQIQAGDYEGAIAAYTDAIRLEPSNPEPYLGRADAYFGRASANLQAQGDLLEAPSDLSLEDRDAIVSDFRQAAELFEAAGDTDTAQSLREQIEFIETGETPGPQGGGPR